MFLIRRLYSVPEIFDPITFLPGVNVILGEPSENSAKTNGVGKSVAIEFINFALLSNYSDSRVSKIPIAVFPETAEVCLDLSVHKHAVTILRTRKDHKKPKITVDGVQHEFGKLEDARVFLENLAFLGVQTERPSLRSFLSILIRDERSEFKSIVNGHNTTQRIPDDYTPHLYLLGIEVAIYRKVKVLQAKLTELQKKIAEFKQSVLLLRNKKLDDARADLNELDAEVAVIRLDLDRLESFESNAALQSELQTLDEHISKLRRHSALLLDQLARLAPVERDRLEISESELSEYYNDLKAGLGDFVSRDLQQLKEFADKIYRFQNDVLNGRRLTLEAELERTKDELRVLDQEYQKRLRVLDQTGALTTLKQTLANFQEKADQLADLRSFIVGHDNTVSALREKSVEKDTEVLKLQADIDGLEENRKSFEQTILAIHSYVMGNRQASFMIKTVEKSQVVEIVFRIDSDGSHSVDREKTFIYDFSLMINELTSRRHLGFLVHDNIFDVDKDTLKRSLKFILEQGVNISGQYILTLNSDRVSADAPELLENLNACVRARLTKANRFLKQKYQQL